MTVTDHDAAQDQRLDHLESSLTVLEVDQASDRLNDRWQTALLVAVGVIALAALIVGIIALSPRRASPVGPPASVPIATVGPPVVEPFAPETPAGLVPAYKPCNAPNWEPSGAALCLLQHAKIFYEGLSDVVGICPTDDPADIKHGDLCAYLAQGGYTHPPYTQWVYIFGTCPGCFDPGGQGDWQTLLDGDPDVSGVSQCAIRCIMGYRVVTDRGSYFFDEDPHAPDPEHIIRADIPPGPIGWVAFKVRLEQV